MRKKRPIILKKTFYFILHLCSCEPFHILKKLKNLYPTVHTEKIEIEEEKRPNFFSIVGHTSP
jgi:hypothetical protein